MLKFLMSEGLSIFITDTRNLEAFKAQVGTCGYFLIDTRVVFLYFPLVKVVIVILNPFNLKSDNDCNQVKEDENNSDKSMQPQV